MLFHYHLLTIYDINTLLEFRLANTIQVENNGSIAFCILNYIDSSRNTFLNMYKVTPTRREPILINSTTWYKQRSIVECIIWKSRIRRIFTIYAKRFFYQRNNGCEGRAIIESTPSYTPHAVRNGDRGEARATHESSITYTRHTVRDSDGGKARATHESIIVNTRHAVRDGDGGKARTTIESTFTNTRHTVRNGDRGEARAIIESIISYTRHAVRDGDGGKARTTAEYIKY